MNAPGQQEAIPWWQKYGARGVGCGGGIIALCLGVFNCITVYPLCIVAGIWQMMAAFIVISAEAPCCCMFVEFVQKYSNWVETRPHWQKAAFYVIISLPAIIMCPGLSTVFGSGLIFVTGVLYGLMALGRKGSREDMIAAAQQNTGPANSQSAILVDDPEAWRST
ncbi:calcium channel flower-like isoform X1 [Palaemon carinicauda]|uniref:calcium channel flower-like isoform X1 n=1 Tax=Palaemon carinicauda TaxID=392227 RepID=UPI0035B68BEA